MRRKKKQLERDEIAAAAEAYEEHNNKEAAEQGETDENNGEKEGRIDLNCDPYNREDVEAVKEESKRRECSGVADDVLGLTELGGEAASCEELKAAT